jgi:hypothetical protein
MLADNIIMRAALWTSIGSIATSFTVVLALLDFRRANKKSDDLRRQEVFDKLDDSWREWLRLVIDNPNLDLGDTPLKKPPVLSEHEIVQRDAMINLLMSLLEKAFLFYERDEFENLDKNLIKRMNRAGWYGYMSFWKKDPRLSGIDWDELLRNYTVGFREHMRSL